jgi:hypothetical protein
MQSLVESVESYRGKPQYVQIGSKRRKMFHPFKRWRHSAGEQTTMYWCPPGLNMYAQDFPYAQLISYCDPDVRATYPSYWSGNVPLMIEGQLQEYGDELRQFTIRDVYGKANSPRFEGAVFLAELGETLTSLRKLFSGAVGSLFKSGQAWKHVKHFSLNSEELWLWYRYMLIPTILDAEDIIKAFETQRVIDRVQDGSRNKEPIIETGTFYSHKWAPGTSNTMEIPWRSEINFGTGAAMDILSRKDNHEFGLSAFDIVRGTWEAIPFSFVVDWFINVGDWLTSLRSIEILYAQSYATYAVDVETEIFEGANMTIEGNTKSHSFLMSRVTDIEPPTLPLIDKRWASLNRTIDLIALSIGILKGVLRRK